MMRSRFDELEDAKQGINLSAYAAACGYQLDKRRSSRNSAYMRHPNGDRVVIARRPNGHFIFFTIGDDGTASGTIVDFVQAKLGPMSLGEVRKELRPWLGYSIEPPPAETYQHRIDVSERDTASVIAELGRMQIAHHHAYLRSRGIPDAVLQAPRFDGRVLIDERNNAVFPHGNGRGLCGFERKNRNFTGFAKKGQKAVWISNCFKGDTGTVVVESAIDALSHYVIVGDTTLRYYSVGGSPSQEALQILVELLATANLPVYGGFDADADGEKLYQGLQDAVAAAEKPTLEIQRLRPEAKDWNAQLTEK